VRKGILTDLNKCSGETTRSGATIRNAELGLEPSQALDVPEATPEAPTTCSPQEPGKGIVTSGQVSAPRDVGRAC